MNTELQDQHINHFHFRQGSQWTNTTVKLSVWTSFQIIDFAFFPFQKQAWGFSWSSDSKFWMLLSICRRVSYWIYLPTFIPMFQYPTKILLCVVCIFRPLLENKCWNCYGTWNAVLFLKHIYQISSHSCNVLQSFYIKNKQHANVKSKASLGLVNKVVMPLLALSNAAKELA